MKVRDSGMPEQQYWESLMDVPVVLDGLNVDGGISNAAEVGCGYGTFTLPIAKRVRGILHAFDIERDTIELTRVRSAAAGVRNIRLHLRDVVANGFGLPAASMDAVFLFNILHAENPVALLRASAELVRSGGRVLAVHWRSDVRTPRGPDLSIRPRPADVAAWARAVGLETAGEILLPPWHFGMALRRSTEGRAPTPIFWADPGTGISYSLQVQIPEAKTSTLEDLGNVPVHSTSGQPVLLRNIATIDQGTAVGTYERYNLARVVSITANIYGSDLGTATRAIRQAITEAGPPPEARTKVDLRGQVVPLGQLLDGFRSGLVIAVIVIFLLLAANFQHSER